MKVTELSQLLEAKLSGDAEREIRGVAGLDAATPGDLAYAEGERALEQAARSRAGCIIIPMRAALAGQTTLAVAQPKIGFVRAAEMILAAREKRREPQVHETAIVARSARVAPDASVGQGAVIEDDAKIGSRTRIGAGVYLGEGAEVGEDCVLHPRVTVYPGARIGDRVILHAGVVIGSDGFGYVFFGGRHHKFPQIGRVVIEDDVEIGSNSTVDRGSLGTTVIGAGAKIDNLVQIAHNVKIGRHAVIAAQTGISGSCEIGDGVMIGGQAGLGDHARVESGAVVGGQAGILPGKIVRKGTTVWGTPSRPLAEFKRMHAELASLPELAKKVRKLTRKSK